jgi:hypothetical protein
VKDESKAENLMNSVLQITTTAFTARNGEWRRDMADAVLIEVSPAYQASTAESGQ